MVHLLQADIQLSQQDFIPALFTTFQKGKLNFWL